MELATRMRHTTTTTDWSERWQDRKDECHRLGGDDDRIGDAVTLLAGLRPALICGRHALVSGGEERQGGARD